MGLDTVELVFHVEDKFAVSLPDDELGTVATVGQLADLVFDRVSHRPDAPTKDAIIQGIITILVDEFGVPRARINPESRFTDDLNLD